MSLLPTAPYYHPPSTNTLNIATHFLTKQKNLHNKSKVAIWKFKQYGLLKRVNSVSYTFLEFFETFEIFLFLTIGPVLILQSTYVSMSQIQKLHNCENGEIKIY